SYVANFASEVVQRVYAASRQLDRELLNDLFHDVTPDDAKRGMNPRAGVGPKPDNSNSQGPMPEPTKAEYRLSPLRDGFVVSSTGVDLQGRQLRIVAAYETSKGNPFKAYSTSDFIFGEDSVTLECKGCLATYEAGNALLIQLTSTEFSVRA